MEPFDHEPPSHRNCVCDLIKVLQGDTEEYKEIPKFQEGDILYIDDFEWDRCDVIITKIEDVLSENSDKLIITIPKKKV